MNSEVSLGPVLTDMVDQFFANSLSKTVATHAIYLSYHILKLILLSVFVGIFYAHGYRDELFTSWILAVAVSVGYCICYSFVLFILGNCQAMMDLANAIQHGKPEALPLSVVPSGKVSQRVSGVYDYTAPELVYSDEQKNIMESNMAKLLGSIVTSSNCYLKIGLSLLNLCSLALIIYFVDNLATLPHSHVLLGVTITYVVIESIAKYDYLLVCLLVVLSPIIMIVFCFVICCCKKEEGHEIPPLDVVEYNAGMVLEETECKICFQDYALGDKLILLPCNNKHMYHQFCINSWFKVSNTCPLCRKNIVEMVAEGAPK